MTDQTHLAIGDREDMERFASLLASRLRAGDVIILTGNLGAGKTALTQFLATALGVTGRVSSPTFVIARAHANPRPDRPPLVHVDAYRLGDAAEFSDLDLEYGHDEAVTVIEWGRGLAEGLAEDRLEIVITRAGEDPEAAPDADPTSSGDPTSDAPATAPDTGPLDVADLLGDGSPGPVDLTEAEEDETRTIRLIPTGPSWQARISAIAAAYAEQEPT
ncbi:tRNA (adenosine(37)-N6)-threonylcarbamoyltransferase complex ATPase subunit type 1 TsaE [Brevibacterium sp. p3-SID960]|uniref:tRNA (adenosine(37)-N6)-threonylcarbamoyltransferase complex ATPase subunit type 1 TsaE n=1 Tax=Brevibacterium sp. p3-SID960 TaxID=2916063 RepID=UPI002882FCA3|nr:tRNA (adenosine(37)-N6)-threonylcarbamoyltransferase complex ATPase subunit type 1 TsaE [Brevibacterium sp. p3-SID960]